jgi:hypothetical protein
MRAQENSTIAESSSSLGVLTLVETSGHEKDGTQNQHGNHASGQKTASVTSHEIHHVVSCKRLIVGPNELRAVLVPTALEREELNSVVSRLLAARAIGMVDNGECYGEVLTTAIGFRPRGLGATKAHFR